MTCPNPHRPERPRWLPHVPVSLRGRHTLNLLGAGAGLLATVALLVALPHAPGHEQPDGGVPEEHVPDATADTQRDEAGTFLAGKRIPEKPPKGAKTPPCTPRTEVRINGACWAPHAESPPCPAGTYEHGERCYMKVAEVPKTPNTLEE